MAITAGPSQEQAPLSRNAGSPYNPAALVILRSSDLVDFYVLKAFLSYVSPFFKDMFDLPPATTNEIINGFPVIPVAETSETIRILLNLIYPHMAGEPIGNVALFLNVCKATQKYCMDIIEDRLRKQMITSHLMVSEPLRAYAVAIDLNWEDVALFAARNASKISLDKLPYAEELQNISGSGFYRFLNYKLRRDEGLFQAYLKTFPIAPVVSAPNLRVPSQARLARSAQKPFDSTANADVILRSNDLVDFFVLEDLVRAASHSLPSPNTTVSLGIAIGENNVRSIINIAEDSEVLRHLLSFIYNISDELDIHNCRMYIQVVLAARRYGMAVIETRLQKQAAVSPLISEEPLRMFIIASALGWAELARSVAINTLSSPLQDMAYMDEFDLITGADLYRLVRFRCDDPACKLWQYNSNLVFKNGEVIDLDLLDKNRSLLYAGKLFRQPDSGLVWCGWSELFVLLFDNYLVMTKIRERDGVTKYIVNRRPIPLDLLTLVNYNDPPTQPGAGLLTSNTPGASPDTVNDSRYVYPLTLHHNGRMGGAYLLYAESQQARMEWKTKLDEALALRRAVHDSNKPFEIETLSTDAFLLPTFIGAKQQPSNREIFTGKVSCSVPITTSDGRALVAIGCTEGVWIGFRHDPNSLRRVLHLKMVTQCAMLEEFGIFLVLANKSLFAYHIEALVSSSPHTSPASQVPQKLNGSRDVHFFRVGTLHNRTLVVYMKKKGLNSIFRVLEPVGEKINQNVRASVGLLSRLGLRSAKSEWFRIYKDFFVPSEAFDFIFLKARVAILCANGFEIVDLHNFDSVIIPRREDPRLAQIARRCESARPKGMFRSAEDEFLLCYDEFGVYVDKYGDPSRSAGTIEWEGNAERVALHSPYILLFDSRFIEIRHIATGRLAQIIPGNYIRCIWDGRGIGSNVSTIPVDRRNGDSVQKAQVHAVMTSTKLLTVGNRKAIAQSVFELIPTVPLYLPGSLAGLPPSGASMPQSQLPPDSPQLRASGSW